MFRHTAALASAAVLAVASLATSTAAATPTGTTAACTLNAGSVTSAGGQTYRTLTSTVPPTAGTQRTTANVFPAGAVRLTSMFIDTPNEMVPGSSRNGYVVIGDSLYSRGYSINGSDQMDPSDPGKTIRVGGGWTPFRLIERSFHRPLDTDLPDRTHFYGLRGDGVLFRWKLAPGFQAAGSAAGFSAVKSMALISQTATYDTFLANTRAGALYTIRIPVTSPMKPVVKQVRASGWSGRTLIANRCGVYGSLLLAVNDAAKTGALYAVGHANGPMTVINTVGTVPASFGNPIQFRWAPESDYLNGE
ncbi:hypothetical protein ABZX12_41055 [Kribbella sp. NPDC003505]|uniref:hypothetical protein n=1 Tax=Kribbella sp. NPDC003505 TaxID=3154448 RepID=UPI0033A3EAA3